MPKILNNLKRTLCLLLPLLLSCGLASAAEHNRIIDLSTLTNKIDTTAYVSYIRDPDNTLTFESILERQDSFQYYKSITTQDAFGVDNSSFWFRVELSNPSAEAKDIVIELSNPVADYVDFYSIDEKNTPVHYSTGVRKPYRDRAIDSHHYAFPLFVSAKSTKVFYIKAMAAMNTKFPITIYSHTGYEAKNYHRQIILGLFVGIIFGLFFYNAFLYFYTRIPVHRYYLFLTFLSLMFTLSRENLLYQFIPNSPRLNVATFALAPMLWGICLMYFYRAFMQTEEHFPRFDRYIKIFIAYFFLATIWLTLELGLLIFMILFVAPALLFSTSLLYVIVLRWREGYTPAKWFFIGLFSPIAGYASLSLSVIGLIPSSEFLDLMINHSEVIQVIIFSIGLAEYSSNLEQKQLNTEKSALLEAASNKVKTRFLAKMSYIIRSSMTTLIANTELLKHSKLHSEQTRYISTIENSCTSLLAIIDDIIEFNKTQNNTYTLSNVPFDLEQVVNESILLFIDRAESKNITLTADVSHDESINLSGDAIRLRQILLNLTSNALKFTDSGEIKISANIDEMTDQSCRYRFEVTDTGIGISQEAQQKLFLSFQQADSTTSEKYGGTGLGLHISKQLVDLMKGEIGVSSELDQGSTFWFTCEFENSIDQQELQSEKPNTLPMAQKVLLYSENPVSSALLDSLLGLLGVGITKFSSIDKLLQYRHKNADEKSPVLIDFRLHDFAHNKAIQTIRRFEKEHSLSSGYIIVTSANVASEDIQHCIDNGANNYLNKPINLKSLKRAFNP